MPSLNSPLLKPAPIPPGFVSLSPRVVAPVQSKATEYACSDCGHKQTHNEVCDVCGNCCGFKKVALDALLEMINDEEYATHQHHSDPDFTTQNGKDYAGRGSTEVEEGALNDVIPGRLLASKYATTSPAVSDPDTVVGYMGNWPPKEYQVPDYEQEIQDFGQPVHHMVEDAEFEDWTRAKGIQVPEFPKEGSVQASKCAACESGDCLAHGGTINDLTNTVVPGVPQEPTVEDATFFKESENDFELSRTASGIVLADLGEQEARDEQQEQLTDEELAHFKDAATKSYGAGTPNGGTPSTAPQAPPNPDAPVATKQPPPPPPPNAVPPVTTVNKTPLQLSQEAENSPQESGNLTQQQLNQVVDALKTSSSKEAGIPIKETPTSLPPRDDIRRHLDEGAQAEVMEGVHDPAPVANAATPQQPQQSQARPAPSAEQELLYRALAAKTAGVEDPRFVKITIYRLQHIQRAFQAHPEIGQQLDIDVDSIGDAIHYLQQMQNLMETTMKDVPWAEWNKKSSIKTAWETEDDDDGPDGAYGTMYGKPLGSPAGETSIKDRLEYLRSQLKAERISYGELNELASLAEYIEPDDVELLEAAGVPEEEAMARQERSRTPTSTTPKKRFRTTDYDKWLLRQLKVKAKQAVQTEDGVNQVCPACHSQDVKKFENTDQENGSLVECIACGCFFAI